MPGFAGLPVLYHCLPKTNGLQLGSHGCTLRSRAGDTVPSFSHTLGSQRLRSPRDFLPGGSFQYCPAIQPASPPAEAVGDPGDNSSTFRGLKSLLHLLTGHRMGLWYDPALGGFSPPNPAAQQYLVHSAAPTARTDVFSDTAGEDRQLSLVFHICPACRVSFFSQDSLVALTILRHLSMV